MKINLDAEIEEYREAIVESMEAKKMCFNCEVKRQKAHYRLLKAKEAIRFKEFEVLEDIAK